MAHVLLILALCNSPHRSGFLHHAPVSVRGLHHLTPIERRKLYVECFSSK